MTRPTTASATLSAMRPRWRKQYFALSVLLAAASQTILLVAPWIPARTGDFIDPFDAVGLLVLGLIGATAGSVVLSAVGALLWLRGAMRGRYDIDLAIASAFNAYPLVYFALNRYLGMRW